LSGTEISPDQITKEVIRIKGLFGKYGGVTFGGGEATLQRKELLETTALLHKQCHLTIETNGSTEHFDEIVEAFDLLIMDLKCITDEIAIQWIGHTMSKTIKNIKLAAQSGKDLIIRIPFITGVNNNDNERQKIAAVLLDVLAINPSITVEVLRMHHMGAPKYKALDMQYEMESVLVPSTQEAENFTLFLAEQGIHCAKLAS
jgi:pyruvate formate lyase activating enzyme